MIRDCIYMVKYYVLLTMEFSFVLRDSSSNEELKVSTICTRKVRASGDQ